MQNGSLATCCSSTSAHDTSVSHIYRLVVDTSYLKPSVIILFAIILVNTDRQLASGINTDVLDLLFMHYNKLFLCYVVLQY